MESLAIHQVLFKIIIIKTILFAPFTNQYTFSQSLIKEKLYTKYCDTLNMDTMICIKCTNPGLTIGCKRYACDFKNHCIPMPALPLKNKSKDIRTTLPGGNQKKG